MNAVHQICKWILILPIKMYQICLSPLFPPACRHIPTCSEYTVEAIKVHGIIKGLGLSVKRILSCHPRGTHGYDPVPTRSKDGIDVIENDQSTKDNRVAKNI